MKPIDFKTSYFLAYSYSLYKKRQTFASTLGITLGMILFIVVYALVEGSEQVFINQTIHVAPHITLYKKDITLQQPVELYYGVDTEFFSSKNSSSKESVGKIKNYQELIHNLEMNYSGLTASPVLQTALLLKKGDLELSSQASGVDFISHDHIALLSETLVQGSIQQIESTYHPIVLGIDLAKNLQVTLEDSIFVISNQGIKIICEVAGILETGISAMDESLVYLKLEDVQQLLLEKNTVNQIQIKMVEYQQADILGRELEDKYGYEAISWHKASSNILNVFKVQRIISNTLMVIILFVLGGGIFNITTTVIQEKHRDIAILKAIGFTHRDIRKIFLIKSLIFSIAGLILGMILSFIILQIIQSITIDFRGFMKLKHLEVYHPINLYISGCLICLIISIFATLISVKKATHVDPVEIIRGSL